MVDAQELAFIEEEYAGKLYPNRIDGTIVRSELVDFNFTRRYNRGQRADYAGVQAQPPQDPEVDLREDEHRDHGDEGRDDEVSMEGQVGREDGPRIASVVFELSRAFRGVDWAHGTPSANIDAQEEAVRREGGGEAPNATGGTGGAGLTVWKTMRIMVDTRSEVRRDQ